VTDGQTQLVSQINKAECAATMITTSATGHAD